jgi:hypothetical protein
VQDGKDRGRMKLQDTSQFWGTVFGCSYLNYQFAMNSFRSLPLTVLYNIYTMGLTGWGATIRTLCANRLKKALLKSCIRYNLYFLTLPFWHNFFNEFSPLLYKKKVEIYLLKRFMIV